MMIPPFSDGFLWPLPSGAGARLSNAQVRMSHQRIPGDEKATDVPQMGLKSGVDSG